MLDKSLDKLNIIDTLFAVHGLKFPITIIGNHLKTLQRK